MKLTLDTDEQIDDPSPAQIEATIGSLPGRGEGAFAILARADEFFIQAAYLAEPRGPGGGFMLEYREGSAESHFRCDNLSLSTADVTRAFLNYRERRDDYKRDLAWRTVAAAHRRQWIKLIVLLGGAVGLAVTTGIVFRAFGRNYAAAIGVMIALPLAAWAVVRLLSKKRAA